MSAIAEWKLFGTPIKNKTTTWNNSMTLNETNHYAYTLGYDSISKTLSVDLYKDAQLFAKTNGEFSISAFSFPSSANSLGLIGHTSLTFADLNIFDRVLTEQEIGFLHDPSTIPPAFSTLVNDVNLSNTKNELIQYVDDNAVSSYNDLSDLPTLFNGAYGSLSGLPTLFNGAYRSLSGLPTLFNGAYSSLSGLPTLFNGTYSSLSRLPDLQGPQNQINALNNKFHSTTLTTDAIFGGMVKAFTYSTPVPLVADFENLRLFNVIALSSADFGDTSIVRGEWNVMISTFAGHKDNIYTVSTTGNITVSASTGNSLTFSTPTSITSIRVFASSRL